MDSFRIQSLIKERKILKAGQVKPEDTYIQVGVYQRGNRKIGSSNANTYPSYTFSLEELKGILDIKSGICPIEYTKINTHSFVFQPSLDDTLGDLVIGGRAEKDLEGALPVWSDSLYDYYTKYTAGAIENITSSQATIGVPTPINLTPLDVITMTGTAYFNNYNAYQSVNYDLFFVLGVYYFNCSQVNDFSGATAFTFVPLLTEKFDTSGKVCFAAEAVLGSNFDYHDTRLIVGAQIYKVCKLAPGDCLSPLLPQPNRCSVSYTIDIASPCEKIIPEKKNYIIKNCCVPEITELVNMDELVVGSFYSDSEGNCWEVVEEATDVTNFNRTFVSTFTSCTECIASLVDGVCPKNLKIISCCPGLSGQEFVTGSLPGLNVGDFFTSNAGTVTNPVLLCWEVTSEVSAPITEESITVYSTSTDCINCTFNNPCPTVYFIASCCGKFATSIASNEIMNPGDSFVDTNGICWEVSGFSDTIPQTYGIIVDTVYTGAVEPQTNCDLCKLANSCPTEYFITIRQCCNTNRTEVVQVPAEYMAFSEGTIFKDYWGVCWEVMSFSTTGTPTGYEIWGWDTNPNPPIFAFFETCGECIGKKINCRSALRVKSCQTSNEYNVITNGSFALIPGEFYYGYVSVPDPLNPGKYIEIYGCYEVLSYYDPTYPTAIGPNGHLSEISNCSECNSK